MVTNFSKILLWITVLYFKALPCVSQSSFRGTYYSGNYDSENEGTDYNAGASDSVPGPDLKRFIYVVIGTVCCLFLSGLIYFLIGMCVLQRRENRRNILMLPLSDIDEQSLPCVSRGRSRVRVGRKMSYSGDGTSYGSGGSYSGTDSETRDKRGAYVFLYVLMEIVCFVAVVGLRYFFKD